MPNPGNAHFCGGPLDNKPDGPTNPKLIELVKLHPYGRGSDGWMSAWMVAGSLRTTDASAAQWLQLQVTLVGPPVCASQNPHKCGLEHGLLGWPSMLVSEYKSICCSGARRVRFADPAFIRLYLYLLVGWGQRMSGLLNDNSHVLADTSLYDN